MGSRRKKKKTLVLVQPPVRILFHRLPTLNSSRTSTPVDKSKPKTERLTGEKNAGSLPPKLDKVTNGPPVKNKSQAEKGAERSAGIDKKLSSTPPPSDINRLPANTNNKAAKTLTGGTAPSTAPKASKLLGTSPK